MEESRVLFSDETRISLYGGDRSHKALRRPGERYAEVCFKKIIPDGEGSDMF